MADDLYTYFCSYCIYYDSANESCSLDDEDFNILCPAQPLDDLDDDYGDI